MSEHIYKSPRSPRDSCASRAQSHSRSITENRAESKGLDRRGIHNSIGAPASEWSFVTGPRMVERGLYGTRRKEEASKRARQRERERENTRFTVTTQLVLTPFYSNTPAPPPFSPFSFQSQLVITSNGIAMPFSKLPLRPRLLSALIASRRRSHSLLHPFPSPLLLYWVFSKGLVSTPRAA